MCLAGLKGTGGKVIILEEASRLDVNVFTEVVAPLLGVSGTVLIGISTPLESDNFYSELVRAVDATTGQRVFLSLEIKLVCDTCVQKGVRVACPHTNESVPVWKSDERRGDIVRRLISDKDQYAREHLGVITEGEPGVFDRAALKRFAELSVSTRNFRDASRIFVAVDTAGGGASSMAVVGGVYSDSGDMLTIVSASAARVDNDADMHKILKRHFEDLLRPLPGLAELPVILVVEQNFGGWTMASHVTQIAYTYGRPLAGMSADRSGKGRVGVLTTAETKEKMVQETQQLLRGDHLRFADNYNESEVTRKEIVEQLGRFRYVHKGARDNFGKDVRVLTGKTNSKSDDLAMALQMLTVWPTRWLLAHDSLNC